MSTHARVGIVNADKTITSIYTHSDGYVRHHGPILLNCYSTEPQIRMLLALGDLSRLGEQLGAAHNFNRSYAEHPEWCCSFSRDRSELDADARVHASTGEYLDHAEEYMYLFENNKWLVWGNDESNEFKDLALEIVTERLTS